MTPQEAREWLRKLYRVGIGQMRIARAENTLKISLYDVMKDDDLVVIFAEETKQ